MHIKLLSLVQIMIYFFLPEDSLDVDVNDDVMKGRPMDSENEADDPLTENEGINTPLLTRRKRVCNFFYAHSPLICRVGPHF